MNENMFFLYFDGSNGGEANRACFGVLQSPKDETKELGNGNFWAIQENVQGKNGKYIIFLYVYIFFSLTCICNK